MTARCSLMLYFSLPELPPSVNKLYRNMGNGRHGRAKTKEYNAWIDRMLVIIKPPCEPITAKIRVEYTFKRPDRRRRDVANLEKALSDILQKAGVFKDDCQIDEIIMRWTDAENVAPTTIFVALIE